MGEGIGIYLCVTLCCSADTFIRFSAFRCWQLQLLPEPTIWLVAIWIAIWQRLWLLLWLLLAVVYMSIYLTAVFQFSFSMIFRTYKWFLLNFVLIKIEVAYKMCREYTPSEMGPRLLLLLGLWCLRRACVHETNGRRSWTGIPD